MTVRVCDSCEGDKSNVMNFLPSDSVVNNSLGHGRGH